MIKSIWAPGADRVYAGPGNDTIDGGSHTGAIGRLNSFRRFSLTSFGNFATITQGVTLDLASTNPQNLGVYGIDTYLNFEDVWWRSGQRHTFSGRTRANALWTVLGGNDLPPGLWRGRLHAREDRASDTSDR